MIANYVRITASQISFLKNMIGVFTINSMNLDIKSG